MGIRRGGNRTGIKWNKGGAKRRKNYIDVDFSNFADFAEKLDRLNADLKQIFGDAMERAAERVQEDTREAVEASNLPAGGNYSTGDTASSIIRDTKVKWSGSLGEVHLGFDKSKPGAGGFLITGTPKMAPDAALATMYTGKKYQKQINDQIKKDLQEALDELGGG